MPTPETIVEYTEWAKTELDTNFEADETRNWYQANINSAQNTVARHPFFAELERELQQWGEEYRQMTGSDLLMTPMASKLLEKPYESVVDKSFRHNVLWNKKFPEKPKKGWMTQDTLFTLLNDGLRTTVVCKFIDGPDFLAKKLHAFAKSQNLDCKYYSHEKDEGYYAYHFYCNFSAELMDAKFATIRGTFVIEIQLTTQLQDVLRTLTHDFYERLRLQPNKDDTKWKWDYTSSRFRASYLSHALHLIEALILQSRDESKPSK